MNSDFMFRETDIDHVNGVEHCNVTTGDKVVKNRLAKLAKEHPDQVVLMADNADSSVWYHVPWKWIQIRPPRKINMSEERRQELAEKMRSMSRNTE